jgi:hypothetical protein
MLLHFFKPKTGPLESGAGEGVVTRRLRALMVAWRRGGKGGGVAAVSAAADGKAAILAVL